MQSVPNHNLSLFKHAQFWKPLASQGGAGPAELLRLQWDCYGLAEDIVRLLRQPWRGRLETTVESWPPSFGLPIGLLRFCDVSVTGYSGPGPGLPRWAGPK